MSNITIIKQFENHSRPYCVLGVLKTQAGLKIKDEMLPILSLKYDVISVEQEAPGDQFEYPAIKYALDLSKENKCNVLYCHTKGAGNNNSIQAKVRNMWYDEFINHFDDYQKLLNDNKNKPTCITPITGKAKVTWYNAWFINYEVAKIYELQQTSNRWFYEYIFKGHDNIQVIGRIMNDVDNEKLPNGTTNFNTASKQRMLAYINTVHKFTINDTKQSKTGYQYFTYKQNAQSNNQKQLEVKKDDYIIVTMTTWNKRIKNIAHIIDCIMANTMLPDKICINLTIDDFPNKEKDFPAELIFKLDQYKDIVEVNWLKNNTKVWKKLIPTLCKYQDAIIIGIDDDFEYPFDMIETLYAEYVKNDKKYPISGNGCYFFGMHCHCGSGSLTSYKFLNSKNQFDSLSRECINAGSDDIFYSYCALVNGNEYKRSPKMYFTNMKAFQANDAYSTGVGAGLRVDITKTYQIAKKDFESKSINDGVKYICE